MASTSRLPTFRYSPLPTSRHIRVLELHREDDEAAVLKARLLDVDLDDEDRVPYVALSYTWGRPKFSEVLTVNDAILHITPNLAGGLQHFRAISCLKWIWADAVCINQKDNKEKSSQIPLMAKIFRDASQVMIWLGDNPDDISLMKTVQTASRRINIGTKEVSNEIKYELNKSLLSVLQLPWFSRRWVVQELVLNSSVSFFCGNVELAWQRLIRVVKCVYTKNEINSSTSLKTAVDLWSLWQKCNIPIAESSITKSTFKSSLKPSKPSKPEHILDLMDSFDHFDCIDARDRIYAFTALAKVFDSARYNVDFTIDYAQATEQVYVDFAEALVRAGLMMEVFKNAVARNGGENATLPSWVPDWRIVPCHSKKTYDTVSESLPRFVQRTQCRRYHMMKAPMWSAYYLDSHHDCNMDGGIMGPPRSDGVRSSAMIKTEEEKERVLQKLTITPLKLIWTSATFQAEHNTTALDYVLWVLNSLLSLSRFICARCWGLGMTEQDAENWRLTMEKEIEDVIAEAMGRATRKFSSPGMRWFRLGNRGLNRKVLSPLSEDIDFSKSEKHRAEVIDALSDYAYDSILTFEDLIECPRCIFACDSNVPGRNLRKPCIVGTTKNAVLAGDVTLLMRHMETFYPSNMLVARPVAKVAEASYPGPKRKKGEPRTMLEQWAYKIIGVGLIPPRHFRDAIFENPDSWLDEEGRRLHCLTVDIFLA